MLPRLIRWSAPLLLLVVATGCGTSTSEITAPTGARCQTSLTTTPSFTAAGGKVSTNVVAARECDWKIESSSSWVRVTPTSGQGETTLTVTADPNPRGVARIASLSLNGVAITVNQAPSPCQFTVTPASSTVGEGGGTINFSVDATSDCGWTSSGGTDWIALTSGSGSGPGTAVVNVSANGGAARSATITIAGQTITIDQTAAAPVLPPPPPEQPPPPPPPPTCLARNKFQCD